MTIKVLIQASKHKILPELYEWAETFDFELDENGEKTLEPYLEIFNLAQRLENNQLNDEDYTNIQFHIEQINYNELKIQL